MAFPSRPAPTGSLMISHDKKKGGVSQKTYFLYRKMVSIGVCALPLVRGKRSRCPLVCHIRSLSRCSCLF